MTDELFFDQKRGQRWLVSRWKPGMKIRKLGAARGSFRAVAAAAVQQFAVPTGHLILRRLCGKTASDAE